MLRRAFIIVGVIAALFICLSSLGGWHLRTKSRRVREDARTGYAQTTDEWRKDQRALATHWLVAQQAGPDASTMLNQRVPFHSNWKPGAHRLGVPTDVLEGVYAHGKNWLLATEAIDTSGFDLAWLAELPRYGHWDLEADGSPLAELPFELVRMPVPDPLMMRALVKVRLAVGLKKGDIVTAIGEARALARLCASTELVWGGTTAATMLADMADAIDEARRRGIDVSSVEDGISIEDAHRVDRVFRSAPFIFHLDPAVSGLEEELVAGRCAGLAEAASIAALLRGYLDERYEPRLALLGDALARSPGCRIRTTRKKWQRATDAPQHERPAWLCAISVSDEVCARQRAIARLPFMREAIGEMHLTFLEEEQVLVWPYADGTR